jgi:hypothetical protein
VLVCLLPNLISIANILRDCIFQASYVSVPAPI